jgi:phosphatidylglycerophosphate synthase
MCGDVTITTQPFSFPNSARRVQESLLANVERHCLLWLARHTPAVIHSDHLTLLGFIAMILAGAYYTLARLWPPALLLVSVCLAVNWLGDSLDGTLARYRNRQRPRYGFYVDHVVDAFSAVFLLGGLALSGYMSERVAFGMLVCFLLLAIDAYLATYSLGVFRLSIGKFGPTEMRILLAAGNYFAWRNPSVVFFGRERLFFDAAGLVAIPCMVAFLLVSVVRNTMALYRLEAQVPPGEPLDTRAG